MKLQFIISLLTLASTAMALGVGPSSIIFENVLRGGYAEQTLYITNTDDVPTKIIIEKEGDISPWINFSAPNISQDSFTILPRSTFNLQVITKPPLDLQVRSYDGRLIVYSYPQYNESFEGSGLGVNTAIAATVQIRLTGQQIIDYAVESLSIKDAEEGLPVQLSLSGTNKGNVRIRPEISVNIFDRDKKNVVLSLNITGSEILPTTKGSDIFNLSTDLPIGQYWAVVNVSVAGKHYHGELLTFDIMEKGSLRVKGELVRIDNNIYVAVDEIVKITALFKNTGELSVNAKFKGEVYLDGKIVGILESEELLVPVGEEVQLSTFFTPQKEGRHIIKGAVFYSRKVTFEKDSVINVSPRQFSATDFFAGVVIFTLFAVIIFFTYKKLKGNNYNRYERVSEKQETLDKRLDKLIKQGEEVSKKLDQNKKRRK